jgi:leader peptidase (prepilin peptidase)/N-methyltransferase
LSTASSFSDVLFAAEPIVRAAIGCGLGAMVGSFLAVILLRWPESRSAFRGRSRCDGCGETLRIWELVPILSHLALRGKCSRCGAAIDPSHLLIELAAALIGLVALLAHPGPAGAAAALLGWWLLLIAALDARHHWLPDALTLPLIPAGLAFALLGLGPRLDQRLIGAAAGFLILWGIALVYRRVRGREGLGGGDPKLLAGLGAWLGWQQLPFVLLGSGLLGLAALLLARSRGATISATDRLPLGTLMALSAWPIWLLIVA